MVPQQQNARLHLSLVAQFSEPPYADPHVRWCGGRGVSRLLPIPIILREVLLCSRSGRSGRSALSCGSGFFLHVFLTLRLAITFFGFFAFFSLLAFFVTLFRRFNVFLLNSRSSSVCSRGSSVSGENNGGEGQRNKSGGDSGQYLFLIWCCLHFACFGICSKFKKFH